jgi:hypothetical protein
MLDVAIFAAIFGAAWLFTKSLKLSALATLVVWLSSLIYHALAGHIGSDQ